MMSKMDKFLDKLMLFSDLFEAIIWMLTPFIIFLCIASLLVACVLRVFGVIH